MSDFALVSKLQKKRLTKSIIFFFFLISLAAFGSKSSSDVLANQEDSNAKTASPKHDHITFGQRVNDRRKMVKKQIIARGITDPNVLNAMRVVPRHFLVRPGDSKRAYYDRPIPIGYGQTISQPFIVAYMTEAIKLDANSKVLEIGTGSGYQAAICGEIAKEVYSIELIEQLAEKAKTRLKKLGYENVTVRHGDGYFGWKEKAPFDVIIITAAAGFVPPLLIEQLKPGGILILPLGSPYGNQTLVRITKDKTGEIMSERLLPVRFVPMLGQIIKDKRQGTK